MAAQQTSQHTADVVIVGNGALGLSTAVELARRAPDVKVTVVGPAERHGAASTAAAAMLNCFAEMTKYTTGHPAAQARFDIAREALDMWPAWLDALIADLGPEDQAHEHALRASRTSDTFVLLDGQAGQIARDNFAAMRTALVEYMEPHAALDPHHIEGLPSEAADRAVQAVHLHRTAAVDGRAVINALEAAARRLGVDVVPDSVQAVLHAHNTVQGVRLADGETLAADTVLLAAGSASGALVQDLLPPGAIPPLMHSSGLALVTERAESVIPRQVLRAPNGAGFCSVHLVPLAMPNQQYVGSTNLVTCRPTSGPDLGSSHKFLHRVCRQLDRGLAASSIRTWLYGVRAIALDGYPLIGGCSIDGLVFATGAYRGGFSCSPVIARHLVDGILGNPVADGRFDWFIPERAPIQTMTIDTAAAEAAVNVADLADGEDPAYDRESVTEEARRRTLRMYESLDNPIALGPELSTAFTDRAVPEDLARLQSYLHAARDHHPQPWPTSPEPARV